MADSYLLFISQASLKPFRSKFHEKGAFYTGIGYAFPNQEAPFLKQLVSILPKAKLFSQPLGDGHNFESFRQSHKVFFFRDKIIDIEQEILIAQKRWHLEEFSEQCINSAEIGHQEKENLLFLLEEKERLQDMMEEAMNIEQSLIKNSDPEFQVKFVSNHSVKFLTTPPPQMPRLVNYTESGEEKPFIRKGIVGQIVGAGGVGKTHILAQLALALATGTPWLEIYPVEKKGHVFMGLGENGEDDVHRLLWKTAENLCMKHKETFLHEAEKLLAVASFTGKDATFIRKGLPTPFYQTFLKELQDKEPPEGWACIILDPISRFMGLDSENDNASATQFISLLERLSLELNGRPTVLFGHHMNKSSLATAHTDQGASRGSSAITDGVRWQANLEKVSASEKEDEKNEQIHVKFRVVKSNFTPIIPPQLLRKQENGCLKPIRKELPKIIASSHKRKSSHEI